MLEISGAKLCAPTFWGDKLLVVGTIIMGSFFLHPFLGDDLLEISLG